MKRIYLAITSVFLLTATYCQDIIRNDSAAVMKRSNDFIYAFNNFKWQSFRSFFAEDATMFHPTAENAKRVTGKNEIEAKWMQIFPEFGDSMTRERLNITPKDIHLQLYGHTAILTFHLMTETSIGRRSIIWVKQNEVWKIVHLHASRLNLN